MSRKWNASKTLLIIIGVLFLSAIIFVTMQVRTDKVEDEIKLKGEFSLLITIYDGLKPLVNQVLFYNPETRKAAVFDIPVDTGTLITSLKRMDSLDVIFNVSQPEVYLKKMEELTGRSVPFYLFLSLEDVQKSVDLLGGVDIFNSSTFENVDVDPMILLPSGTAVLDGEKAKLFVSLVDPDEPETDRIGRSQKFVQSFLRKSGDLQEYLKKDGVFSYFNSFLKTNMEERGLRSFLSELATMDLERLVFQRVMGSSRLVDGKTLLFPHYNGNLLKETVKQTWDSLKSGEVGGIGTGVRLEILNGTPLAGLAANTVTLYRGFGLEVLPGKNAEKTNVLKTEVIVRKGDMDLGMRVAQYIKCANITAAEDKSYPADVTLLLGKDFDGRYVRAEN